METNKMETKNRPIYPVTIKNLETYLKKLKDCFSYFQEIGDVIENERVFLDGQQVTFDNKVLPVCYRKSQMDKEMISGRFGEYAFITQEGRLLTLWRMGGRGPLVGGEIVHILEHCLTDEKYKHDLEEMMVKTALYGML